MSILSQVVEEIFFPRPHKINAQNLKRSCQYQIIEIASELRNIFLKQLFFETRQDNTPEFFACYPYSEQDIKMMVRYLKKYKDPRIEMTIAENIQVLIQNRFLNQDKSMSYIFIAMPLSKQRYRKRGFNQVKNITDACSMLTTIPVLAPKLIRRRHSQKQALLQRNERITNVFNVFEITPSGIQKIKNKHIIIIDDLITTGVTMLSLMQLLYSHGAKKVIGIGIAH